MIYRFKPWRSPAGKGSDRKPFLLSLPISFSKKKTKSFITEFKSGNEEAFAKLYKRFHKPILRFVQSKISDDEVASELTQEVFIKVFRFRESYQEQYALSTWLWTIARNTISDHLRGKKIHLESDLPGSEPAMTLEEIPSPQKNAEALVIKKDQRRSFLGLMKSLTRPQKRVLWLRAVHQLSFPEISKRLGLSLSAVKNLAYRAKLTLSDNESILIHF